MCDVPPLPKEIKERHKQRDMSRFVSEGQNGTGLYVGFVAFVYYSYRNSQSGFCFTCLFGAASRILNPEWGFAQSLNISNSHHTVSLKAAHACCSIHIHAARKAKVKSSCSFPIGTINAPCKEPSTAKTKNAASGAHLKPKVIWSSSGIRHRLG